MRALIATDLSEASLAAVDAVSACNPVDFSGIVLVHAVELDLYTAGGTVPAVLEMAEDSLGTIAEGLRAVGFDVSVRAEVGPAVDVIERVAAEDNADIVVMSSLGTGALAGRLLGSTAERLASAGNLPVLIERVQEEGGAWCRLGDGQPFRRVLVGTDLCDSLRAQLDIVGRLPGLGEVRVVHVTDEGMDAGRVSEACLALVADAAPGMNAETAVRVGGDPAQEMLDEAAEWGASVIVVSPRAHGIVHRAIWGSTARTIAHRSPVPVLFVPTGDGL